jgi:hypothetical protein
VVVELVAIMVNAQLPDDFTDGVLGSSPAGGSDDLGELGGTEAFLLGKVGGVYAVGEVRRNRRSSGRRLNCWAS